VIEKQEFDKSADQSIPLLSCHFRPDISPARLFLMFCLLICLPAPGPARTIHISILKVSHIRDKPVAGLKAGLDSYGEGSYNFSFDIKDAHGDRTMLPGLAREIVAGRPDIAVAAGGVEADALHDASAGTGVPVVFLSVSSAVERQIVASMMSSGNNLTGIDTGDTHLTAKRLWYVKKLLPDAKKVLTFHVPSIVPSVESVDIAQRTAEQLGLTLTVMEVETVDDIKAAVKTLSSTTADVILQLPVATTDRATLPVIFPKALAEKIPIFGYSASSLESGCFASYSGSRFENGRQAARLVYKIINGIEPAHIPVETPEKLELIINRALVSQLGLQLPGRAWHMADTIVDLNF
jgi:putative ABC transport system substrate-binding protein